MKKLFASVLGAAILMGTVGSAFANSASISVIVPKLGGAVTTGETTRTSSVNNWNWGVSVGGGYTIGIQPQTVNGSIVYAPRQWNNSGSTSYSSLPVLGSKVWANIASGWSTPVNVQVSGSWNTN